MSVAWKAGLVFAAVAAVVVVFALGESDSQAGGQMWARAASR